MKAAFVRSLVALVAVAAAVMVASSAARTEPAPSRGVAEASVLGRFDLAGDAAVQVPLAGGLREISGLAVAPDGHLFAHADERGVVSRVHICDGTVEKSFSLGFPPVRDDFEGMAIVGERFFLMTSTGRLYETREGVHGTSVPYTVVETGFGGVCEVEGLTWDPVSRTLVAGCKAPRAGRQRGSVTFLRWSVDAKAPAVPPSLTLAVTGLATKNFRTSAIEYDARSRNYIAVAGPERQLMEFTSAGVVVASRLLSRQLHRQPEGLALVGDSLLVIGDEGAGQRGTLTCYRARR
jgi:hypothetical protein